jgi:hypothetical protein
VNGATDVDMTIPLEWTTVLDAQAYYLSLGSTLGADDFVSSGELRQMSYLATGLPGGQEVFARLWTVVDGVWRFSDSTFTTAAVAIPAVAALNVPRWTSVQGRLVSFTDRLAADRARHLPPADRTRLHKAAARTIRTRFAWLNARTLCRDLETLRAWPNLNLVGAVFSALILERYFD